MDVIDVAQREIDNSVAVARAKARHSLRNGVDRLEPIGECHYCGEEFEEDSPKLFCDDKCADKHHYQKNGVRRM